MTIALKYTGTLNRGAPFFETAITGKPRTWTTGQIQDCSEADAALLLAAGLFSKSLGLPLSSEQYSAVASPFLALKQQRANRRAAFLSGPAIVAPAWAAGQTIVGNDHRRLSNGTVLTTASGGLTGGSEPTAFYDGRPITDNTVTWYVASPARKTASDAAAPTVLTGANAAAVGLTNVTSLWNNSNLLTVRGARFSQVFNQYLQVVGFASGSTAGGGNANAGASNLGLPDQTYTTNNWALDLDVTDSRFGFVFQNNPDSVVIEVDGQIVEGNYRGASGSTGWSIALDYAGVVAKRNVRILGIGGTSPLINGFGTTAQGYFTKATANDDTMLYLGDSFGSTRIPDLGGIAFGGVGFWLERYLGITEMVLANVGGSGYVSQNVNTYNTPAVLANAANRTLFAGYNPQHVLFAAGFNDRGGNNSAVAAAALASWQAARTLFPNAKITVTDGFTGAGGPDANSISLAAALAAQFSAWGDTNSRFVTTCSTSASTAYVQGTGNAGVALAAGNSSIITSTDGVHPSPGGARYLAARLAADIRAAWADNY